MSGENERLELATAVTTSWVSNPQTRAAAEDVSALLGSLMAALRGLEARTTASAEPTPFLEPSPAVSVRGSLASPDHIISMLDGRPYRSLTRHLRMNGLTPDKYRRRFGLKPDYPMVAPGYSAQRSAAAKQHNFGRPADLATAADGVTSPAPSSPEQTATAPTADEAPTAKKRRRLGIAGAKQAARAHLGTKAEDGVTESPPANS